MPILDFVMSKRDLAELRRIERRVIATARRRRRMAQWRCFWSRPVGHVRDTLHVCMLCGHDASYADPAAMRVPVRSPHV